MTQAGNFIAGGAVPIGARAYIERSFERALLEDLANGTWTLLLGPRQHGKTSALVRVVASLRIEAFPSALIDLQAYGAAENSYADFLAWFANRIRTEMGADTADPLRVVGDQEDLSRWLAAALPSDQYSNAAILIDEASAVPRPHQLRFYSQLRAHFNARARAQPNSIERRVVFGFAGTFRPERLIDSANSPFNVCRYLETEDLSRADAVALASVADDSELLGFVDDAFTLVGGQPYLLQSLFAAAARHDDAAGSRERFDLALANLRSGADPHFAALFRSVREDLELLRVVEELIATDTGVPLNAASDDHRYARVTGIAKSADERLVVRNPLYRALAAVAFLRPSTPERIVEDAEARLAARPAPETLAADVLLVTATGVETAAVLAAFTPGLGDRPRVAHGDVNTYFDLGVVNGVTVKLVQCPTMGPGGSGGTILTVQDAIADVGPKSVVMVGIAFGVDPEKQAIGEVLVSQRILDYELQRVSATDEAAVEIRPRGDRATASARLIGRFDAAQYGWEHQIRLGLLLSGSKLVDNRDFREDLLRLEPDAFGGEMEGAGLYAAASRSSTDWIVIKAICDFADGNKREGKAEKQAIAAERAATYVRHTLELGGF
jgi:nucleoside phosphorylase